MTIKLLPLNFDRYKDIPEEQLIKFIAESHDKVVQELLAVVTPNLVRKPQEASEDTEMVDSKGSNS